MSSKYKIRDNEALYFTTLTIVNWIDLFIRNYYRHIIVDNLKFCQQQKGLDIYSWCLMTSHLHMIIGSTSNPLEKTLHDFKSYTSKLLKKEIENCGYESRQEWMFKMMNEGGRVNHGIYTWQLWKHDNHPVALADNFMLEQKLNYIHNNPVVAGFVDKPEYYTYSSAKDYCGEKGLIDVILIE